MNHPSVRTGGIGWTGRLLMEATLLLASALPLGAAAAPAPLALEKTIAIPGVPVGPYSDHLAIDSATGRIFATPQAAKAVAVLDLKSGRVVKMLRDIANPHGIYYSDRLKRLFVVDGGKGEVKVFSGNDYALTQTIPLTVGADVAVYDPRSRLLYVTNGGEDAGMTYGIVSAIDTARMQKVADIHIATPYLEAFAIDSARQLLYVEGEDVIFVVDPRTRRTMSVWQLPSGHRSKAIALDAARARLYVACRDSSLHGSILVLDSNTGHVMTTLPIGGWVDDVHLDHRRNRIYASTGVGYVETYAIEPHDVYRREPKVESDILAKTSLYSGERDRLYVNVPHLGDFGTAEVLVYKPAP